jgi:hypothetical protein
MLAAWVVFRLTAAAGSDAAGSWSQSLRFALALMFLHWSGAFRAADASRWCGWSRLLPRPDLLVTMTGVFELLGAAGLLVPTLVRPPTP